MAKPKPEDAAEDAKKIVDEAKNFIERAVADIGKTSATKQLILGTTSGWITGFITMKIGKVAAVGLGGSVILLHIASQKGYIDINWDKINKKVDKISDKIEKETTGKSPDWFEKGSVPEGSKWYPIVVTRSTVRPSLGYHTGFAVGVSLKIFTMYYCLSKIIHITQQGSQEDFFLVLRHPEFQILSVERFVDRKLDKAEGILKKKEVKAKRWYNNFTDDGSYRATESHVFLASFVAGMAVGLLCGK